MRAGRAWWPTVAGTLRAWSRHRPRCLAQTVARWTTAGSAASRRWFLEWSSAAARGGRRCPRKSLRFWPTPGRSPPRRWPASGETMGGDARCWSAAGRAPAAASFSCGGGAVGGRRFGDVVTVGPILSRVWFGPVPGSP
ncbi:THO complex subunit 5 [Dorcoceras hygrometricum]|uniref:THO complex subunit 5 n=1 Tax=Dorcoceras hygrometricum TaxID=472368 RepID=A0A2Z7A1K4_9LAMI|nr:THO complex subunit 5 [Dorcoceras hygrometricum]